MRKELGKIKRVDFGFGGYQEVMLGAHFVLGGSDWGVGDSWCFFSPDLKDASEDALKFFGSVCVRLGTLLREAQVENLKELLGVAVEVTFEDNGKLHSWRILKEVL